MATSECNFAALPEWYRIERETEKTVNKLGTVKELDYYLSNPDEYIRRLAIIRLHKVSAKESTYKLAELLDNPAETNENKVLAAWTLKKILGKKDSDFFLYNKYLDKFDGNERYEDLFPVKTEDSCPTVRFDFSLSESFANLPEGLEESTSGRDAFFETSFDFKQWLSFFTSNFSKSILSGFKAIIMFIFYIPVLIGKGFFGVFKKIKQARINGEEARIKEAKIGQEAKNGEEQISEEAKNRKAQISEEVGRREKHEPRRRHWGRKASIYDQQVSEYGLRLNSDTSYDYRNLRKELYKKPGLLFLIKKGGFQMLYLFFAPFRFIRRHKLALLCVVIAAYMVLAYTDYGKAFSYKYFSFDMREVPKIVVQKTKYYSSAALAGLNRLTGIEEYQGNHQQGDSMDIANVSANRNGNKAIDGKPYLVTAKKGLNMRESPDPGSAKIGSEPLKFGSTVYYLSKSQKDSSGILWYNVETTDGRLGWVSAKFLKEKKEG